jgi:hypothetical protein
MESPAQVFPPRRRARCAAGADRARIPGRQWTRPNLQYAFVQCMPTYGQQTIAIHGQKSPYLGMLFQIWQFSAEVYFTLALS